MDGENVGYMQNGILFIYQGKIKLNHHVKKLKKKKGPDSKRRDSLCRVWMDIDTT